MAFALLRLNIVVVIRRGIQWSQYVGVCGAGMVRECCWLIFDAPHPPSPRVINHGRQLLGLSVIATLRIAPAWSQKGRLEAVHGVDWMLN